MKNKTKDDVLVHAFGVKYIWNSKDGELLIYENDVHGALPTKTFKMSGVLGALDGICDDIVKHRRSSRGKK